MSRAKSGDTVIVHYTGRLSDGTEFESTKRGKPVEFTLGKGSMIAGFERAVIGMKAGETKTVAVQPEHAYGNHNKDMVQEFMRSDLPEGLSFQLGMKLRASGPQGSFLKPLKPTTGPTMRSCTGKPTKAAHLPHRTAASLPSRA